MKFQIAIFALIAVASAKTCENGYLNPETNCCVCDTGYSGDMCNECAPGFAMLNGKCGNGRNGTACQDDAAYPFFGCGGVGKCTLSADQSESVFPCVCKDIQDQVTSCANKIIGANSCAPMGARMYTTFPNSPMQGKNFSLTAVACNANSPSMMLIPAFKEDGVTDNFCSNRTGVTGGFPDTCVLSGADGDSVTVDVECREGVVLKDLSETNGGNNMGEYTFPNLVVTKDNFYISELEQPNTHNRNMFKVCMSKVVPVVPGEPATETIWEEVDAHNTNVDKRFPSFHILGDDDVHTRGAGSLEGVGGDDCCDGLKIGFCLPLWAFLLLWLLMALCLGMLGFLLHKNKNEIDAKKNNEKYEKFNTDAEMIEHAAKEADDDDI